MIRDLAALVALSASYIARRPWSTLPALRTAMQLALRARTAPVLRDNRRLLATPDEIVPVCSLVSDTHVVAPRGAPCELEHEPAQWPWALPTSHELTRGLRRILEHLARHAPRTVVWCGDEVDSGDPAEWRQWRVAVDAVPGLAHRLVPGNHDICFNRPFDHDGDLALRARRERAYQQHAGRLADFPVVDTIVGDAGVVTIVLLDSCRHRSTHVLSNAVGYFGDDQLAELARVLDRVRGPVLCVAHHHVWRAERTDVEDWYNVAIDSERLIAVLSAYQRRVTTNQVLICHGHRHVLTAGYAGDIPVVGMPSSTLGDKAGTGVLDGIMRYGIAGLRADGTWAVALREVGPLMSPAHDQTIARAAYTEYMQNAVLEYRGSFRYADVANLDRVLAEARALLDDDDISDVDREWPRFIVRRGTTLRVDAILPPSADRYIAANLLGVLARDAVEGCVEVMRGDHLLDAFTSEARD